MKRFVIILLFGLQFSLLNQGFGQNSVGYPVLKENHKLVECIRVLSLIQKSDLKGLDTISIGEIIKDNDLRSGLQDRISSKKNYLITEIHQYNEALEASRLQALIDRATTPEEFERILTGSDLSDEIIRKDLSLEIICKNQNIRIREKDNQYRRFEIPGLIPLTFVKFDKDKNDRLANFYQLQSDFQDSSGIIFNPVYSKRQYVYEMMSGMEQLCYYSNDKKSLNRFLKDKNNISDKSVIRELNKRTMERLKEPDPFDPDEVDYLEGIIRGTITEVSDPETLEHYRSFIHVNNEILKLVFSQALDERKNQILQGNDTLWVALQIVEIQEVVKAIREFDCFSGTGSIVIGHAVTNREARDQFEGEIRRLYHQREEFARLEELARVYDVILGAEWIKTLDTLTIGQQVTDMKTRKEIRQLIIDVRNYLVRKQEIMRMENEIERVEQEIESANTLSDLDEIRIGNLVTDDLLINGWKTKIEEKKLLNKNDDYLVKQSAQRRAILFARNELRKSYSLAAVESIRVPPEITDSSEIQSLENAIQVKKDFLSWQQEIDKEIENYRKTLNN
jgi:hypothetical protein